VKRIGLFGGTFDPIHLGHLRAAREVQERFELDKICLIPAAIPPHKEPRGIASVTDRMHMIRSVVASVRGLDASEVELQRSGPSYTIDTVYHFKRHLTPATRLFLIVGRDAFLEIDSWKSYKALFEEIPIIVLARPAGTCRQLRPDQSLLADIQVAGVLEGYTFDPARSCYRHPRKQPVHLFAVTSLDISSTRIRGLIKQGRSIQFLVPEAVERFILAKGLYR
jgi:nicotinate-nucleotide adenylyltransferase